MTNHTQVPSATVTVETLPVLAHQGLRVVTTGLLAQCYVTAAKNIHDNFSNNAERFEAGKHYFKLEGEALRAFKHRPDQIGSVKISGNVNALMLWTERGAARHAKLLDTDAAWEVFERLEDAYFRPKADPKRGPARVQVTGPTASGSSQLSLTQHDGETYVAMRHIVASYMLSWGRRIKELRRRYGDVLKELPMSAIDGRACVMTCLPLRLLPEWLAAEHKRFGAKYGASIAAYQRAAAVALGMAPAPLSAPITPSAVAALPAPEAQPMPTDTLPPAVRRAIDLKAHALSLDAFEYNRAYLEAWVRRLPEARDPVAALEHVHALDLDHGQHLLVNFQALYRVTCWAGELRRLAQAMQAEVDALEQATGRTLYVH